MKPLSRIIFTIAVALCASISLTPSPAAGAEETFFQKFVLEQPMNWSGFYVGFNNGASFNHFHISRHMTDVDLEEQFYELPGMMTGLDEMGVFATFDTPGHHRNDTETIGGVQTGVNFQLGHIVFSVDGSFIGNGSTGAGEFHDFQMHQIFLETNQSNVTAETEFGSRQKVETTWNGFVGGNIGFAWNRFLFYGEGGVAFTDVHFESKDKADTSFFQNCDGRMIACDGFSTSGRVVQQQPVDNGGVFIGEVVSKKTHTQGDVLTGWFGGGGIDYALTKIVSVGVEFKHIEWGNVTEHQMEGGGPVFPTNARLDLTADQVVLKVNLLVGPIGH